MVATSDGQTRCGHKNVANSTIFFESDPYGGIPSNLIINITAFFIFILIFLILHKKAYKSVNRILRRETLEKQSSPLKSESNDGIKTLFLTTTNANEGIPH